MVLCSKSFLLSCFNSSSTSPISCTGCGEAHACQATRSFSRTTISSYINTRLANTREQWPCHNKEPTKNQRRTNEASRSVYRICAPHFVSAYYFSAKCSDHGRSLEHSRIGISTILPRQRIIRIQSLDCDHGYTSSRPIDPRKLHSECLQPRRCSKILSSTNDALGG